jgi:hypothetical protein
MINLFAAQLRWMAGATAMLSLVSCAWPIEMSEF